MLYFLFLFFLISLNTGVFSQLRVNHFFFINCLLFLLVFFCLNLEINSMLSFFYTEKITFFFTYNINIFLIISLLISFIFFLYFNIIKQVKLNKINLFVSFLLFFLTILLTSSHNIVNVFICFESIIFLSIISLKVNTKNDKMLEAILEMTIWTLFGTVFFILGFVYLLNNQNTLYMNSQVLNNISVFFFLLGFSIKLPIYPFYSWLLKAHVEATVEFSILLSGFIIKIGVYCFWLFLYTLNSVYSQLIIYFLTTVSLISTSFILLEQTDLKKIVALTTLLEINWIIISISNNTVSFSIVWSYLLVVHSIATACEFFVVEYVYKTYKTRNITNIAGLYYTNYVLWLFSFFTLLVTIGFPGTFIFLLKFLYFSELLYVSPALFVLWVFFFMFFIPLVFFKIWIPVWFGSASLKQESYINTNILVVFFIFFLCNFLAYLLL